ncbi:DJ-1/PfpI family protein [Candidatus Margulisiibacteriota bacterium]
MSLNAAIIIAHNGYRDEEYWTPRQIFEQNEIVVTTVSSALTTATGKLGKTVKPDLLITEVNSKDYDVIVFVGGPGANEYFDDPAAHKLARDFEKLDKLVTAICIAPVILCRAGLLRGRSATVFPSGSAELTAAGVSYTGDELVCDGNIITASGPQAAEVFAREIVRRLKPRP